LSYSRKRVSRSHFDLFSGFLREFITVKTGTGMTQKREYRAIRYFDWACSRNGNRPFLLPVGDEEEERKRGDDEVDEEDHEEPAHDISEMQFSHSEHGDRPEGLDHVGHHI